MSAKLIGLIFLVQREVGVFPIREDAQALKLGALQINKFAGISLAGLADGGGIGAGVAGLAHLLAHLELNGQAMAVPAGDIRGAEAAQRLVLDDDVLENLVQRSADMHIAIGEGRAVVENEFLSARARRLDLLIKAGGPPFPQPLRFARDEVGFHREVRARQI